MNFDFNEDQKLLQSEARRFLRENCEADKARSVLDNHKLEYDPTLWQQVTKQGWTGIAIPEEFGGHGYGYLELCLVAQELGRALAPIPFASTVYLFTEVLKLSEYADKAELLSRVTTGSLIGCLASSETAGDDVDQLPSTFFQKGLVTGTKIAVADGVAANYACVTAKDSSGGLIICLVDLEQSAITRTSVNSIDASRPLADITFNQAKATPLEFAGSAQVALRTVLNRAATLMAFEQVGGAEAALKMGIKYAKERHAFNRQIASFQAIKHKFADIYVANEIALSNAYYAAWALSSNAPELPLAAATARVSASDAYFLASKESLQAHGGMGYTWEFDCHLHYRRAQHLALTLGSSITWSEQISTELLKGQGEAA